MLLVLGLLGTASAAETPPFQPPAGMPYFRSGGTATYSADATQPSTATGGVEARYDGIVLRSDNLALRYALLAGTTFNIPDNGSLQSGPAGPADNRVILDTREATAPNVGFRGLFSPTSVTLQRTADENLPAGQVHYSVTMPDAGDFQGLLKLPSGWSPYRGWADHIDLLIGADVVGGSLTNLHVLRITLFGRPAGSEGPERNAEINRLRPEIALPAPGQPLTAEQVAGHNDARVIYIEFDAQGRPGTRWEGRNNLWGDPQLFQLGTKLTP